MRHLVKQIGVSRLLRRFLLGLKLACREIIAGNLATLVHLWPISLLGYFNAKNLKNMVAISLYFGRLPSAFQGAGVAQLVEHHLAKVTVVSSSLITRSIFLFSLRFF